MKNLGYLPFLPYLTLFLFFGPEDLGVKAQMLLHWQKLSVGAKLFVLCVIFNTYWLTAV